MKTECRPAKCTPSRGYAHCTRIARQDGKYSWGVCRHCKARRLFRNGWPDLPDWSKEREARLREERKLKRKERRDADKKRKG